MVLWKGRPRRTPPFLGAKGVKSLRRGNPLLGEEAAPVLSPKPPTCSHSAVVASAAKGQLRAASFRKPKPEKAERGKGGSRSNGAGGKRSGAAVQAPALVSALAGSPNGQTVYKDMSRLLKTQIPSIFYAPPSANPKP